VTTAEPPIESSLPPPEALSAFGLSPARESRFLPAGLMNRNWRLETAEGSFALKELFDIDAPQARRNLAVLASLAGTGLPIPVPVSDPDGDPVVEIEGRAFYLFPWVAGERITGLELTKNQIEDLGALLGRLHSQLDEPSVGLPSGEPGPSKARSASEADGQADRFEAIIAGRPHTDAFDEQAAELLRSRRVLLDAHGDSRPSTTRPDVPTGWIHGDFHSTNLLWSDGRVSAVLDWDRLRVQPYGEEVVRAALLHFKADEGHLDLQRVAAFIASYRSVVPISAAALADALHRLWWHHLTNFWILGYHYDRVDFSCDHLLEPRENLLRWWTEHREEVRAAFTGRAA
jgi:homoserine kinase type II